MADVESGNMKKSASLQDVLGSKNNLKTDSVFRWAKTSARILFRFLSLNCFCARATAKRFANWKKKRIVGSLSLSLWTRARKIPNDVLLSRFYSLFPTRVQLFSRARVWFFFPMSRRVVLDFSRASEGTNLHDVISRNACCLRRERHPNWHFFLTW